MRTCPCGFEAAADIPPTSPLWHRQHRVHHLQAYPNVDQGTLDSLERLIYTAEHHALSSFVQGNAPIDGQAMHEKMAELLELASPWFGGDPVQVMTALVGAVGAYACSTSIADKLLEIAVGALQNARDQLAARNRLGAAVVS